MRAMRAMRAMLVQSRPPFLQSLPNAYICRAIITYVLTILITNIKLKLYN